MTQPSRLIFWRSVLLLTTVLPFLAIWQFVGLAEKLDVVILASKSWMGLLTVLGVGGLAALLALASTCFRTRERILSLLEIPARVRWPGFFLFPLALIGYTLVFAIPFSRNLLGGLGWARTLIFWAFVLAGMYGLKAIRGSGKSDWQSDLHQATEPADYSREFLKDQNSIPWLTTLLLVVLFAASLHLLATQFSGVTSYPFAMGWSETSRYYYPSLFLSTRIFGSRLPWPILHPSLHLLLTPPYFFDAPLWFHRFWQVFLRFALLGLTAQVLIWRLSIKERVFRWLLWAWMVLYLFQGPVYFHLAVPLILMLWGYSRQNGRRTWIFLIIASIWSGLSRINWYPMPGILASVLFLLEVPYQGKKLWRYLLKPVLWTIVGFGIAFATQRAYIALSGIPDPEFFYTSLTSNLLWYRLFPNASYQFGVLPVALFASLPMWAAILTVLRQHRGEMYPLRLGLIFAALLVLFAGGLVVSMKIGGGVDIHNMDAYLGMLLIITAYLVFARYAPETGIPTNPVTLHWSVLALLVAVPAWFALQGGVSFKAYDVARTQAVLTELQAQADDVNARGGEILFITQRHLVSMHMLDDVTMIPEYEREELMEMAMGNNQDYLRIFRTDMDNQRFVMIVVDPLNFRLLGKNYAFGEENNAWAQRAMKPILCNYQEALIFPEDQVAIYTPQEGERQCP
jgi:hypothetical protein